MNYKINIFPVNPIGNIRANVSIICNEIICLRGINIKESNEGRYYVDFPKSNNYNERLIVEPTEFFITELCQNIIDTFRAGKTVFEKSDSEVLETRYLAVNRIESLGENLLN